MAATMTERKQTGFSLVELMVGMVLGLMLIAGAVSIYLASKRSYVEVEQVAALTESARFAEQLIGDSLRHAGFFGEVSPSSIERDSSHADMARDCDGLDGLGLAKAHNLNQFVYAETATSNSVLGCIDDAMPDTDVLVIKHVASQPYTDGPRDSFDPNDPSHGDGVIDTPGPLQNNKTYVLTNNITGVMFDGNDTVPSAAVPDGTAWEYQYEVFYIRDAAIPQLSRKTLSWTGTAMEIPDESEDIAEGVENLRVLLGYSSGPSGEVDTYKTPTEVTATGNWSNVQSVEVFMLTRSATRDVQYTDTKTYQIGGDPNDPVGPLNDNYRRLISHASVSLRNRKLIIRGGA
jgi:type IV pilus assembly protein PilW